MRRDPVSTPARLPAPAADLVGCAVHVPASMARYHGGPFWLRVTCVREDISLWYGGDWVWLEGIVLVDQGAALGRVQVLVHVGVFAASAAVRGVV
ncbi:hypothetical protein [Asanoa siamensis]|uniref:Uncharacterized protein n=1 Tax=Asanoa siamensis TaxID=926357 RepID=A0ABQ4CVI1_9ACTN|nr:hypothetical protein [Asanoa siamensis]GIF75302.1 hypothetical protein Asi02nite_48200 [Asanoa siamensis]